MHHRIRPKLRDKNMSSKYSKMRIRLFLFLIIPTIEIKNSKQEIPEYNAIISKSSSYAEQIGYQVLARTPEINPFSINLLSWGPQNG